MTTMMMIDKHRYHNEIEKYTPKHAPDIDKLFGVWYSLFLSRARVQHRPRPAVD